MTAPLMHPAMTSHRHARIWVLVPLALVILTLLGSVAVPARQSWLITRLLRQSTQVFAPARLLEAELRSGLGREIGLLQRYALFDDSTFLETYRTTAIDNEKRLATLDTLATHLDPATVEQLHVLRDRIHEWRRLNTALVERHASHDQFAPELKAGQARFDAAIKTIDELSLSLNSDAVARDERVRALEQLSLAANATLVLAALVAAAGVLILTLRERRLAAALHRLVEEESALRHLARRLSAAMTTHEALHAVAEETLAITRARGVYAEWKISPAEVVDVLAVANGDAPAPGARTAYAGSLTEARVARDHDVGPVTDDVITGRTRHRLAQCCERCTTLVAPLLASDETLGVLVLLRDPAASESDADERRQLRRVSDLASASLRRINGMEAERRALADARRLAHQEAALRSAAEVLAGAFTTDEVTQRIVHAAVEAMEGRGAFVERITAGSADSPGVVLVTAVAGTGTPPWETTSPFAGSYTESVTRSGEPLLIPDLAQQDGFSGRYSLDDSRGTAIVVPLVDAGTPWGALFVISTVEGSFRADDVTRAGIFGHLAALAYQNVRLLEEAIERRRVLERVMQSRSRLMRGFSHDVKNPIGAVDGYAELMSDGIYGALSPEQLATLRRMRRSLRGALSLIDDLQVLARAEAGKIMLSPSPVDVGALVQTLVDDYDATARANGLSLTVDAASDGLVIQTDAARVRQIASNLLSNAIKYTEHGSVTVRAIRGETGIAGDPDGSIRIEFIDTGPGIPADQRDFIFEEFSRLGAANKTGAGLGLAISKLLAVALGGDISVASEVGHGSTFTLSLPLRHSDGSSRR